MNKYVYGEYDPIRLKRQSEIDKDDSLGMAIMLGGTILLIGSFIAMIIVTSINMPKLLDYCILATPVLLAVITDIVIIKLHIGKY
jgi:hypothetical protein